MLPDVAPPPSRRRQHRCAELLRFVRHTVAYQLERATHVRLAEAVFSYAHADTHIQATDHNSDDTTHDARHYAGNHSAHADTDTDAHLNSVSDTVPAGGERADLVQALDRHRFFLRNTLRGLTDEQAAQRTTVSELTLAGLIKHVTVTERQWSRFIIEGPSAMGAPDEQAVI